MKEGKISYVSDVSHKNWCGEFGRNARGWLAFLQATAVSFCSNCAPSGARQNELRNAHCRRGDAGHPISDPLIHVVTSLASRIEKTVCKKITATTKTSFLSGNIFVVRNAGEDSLGDCNTASQDHLRTSAQFVWVSTEKAPFNGPNQSD